MSQVVYTLLIVDRQTGSDVEVFGDQNDAIAKGDAYIKQVCKAWRYNEREIEIGNSAFILWSASVGDGHTAYVQEKLVQGGSDG